MGGNHRKLVERFEKKKEGVRGGKKIGESREVYISRNLAVKQNFA